MNNIQDLLMASIRFLIIFLEIAIHQKKGRFLSMTTTEKIKTAAVSMVIGAGAVCQLGGNYYKIRRPNNNPEADRAALEKDWRVIGQDLDFAIKTGRQQWLGKI
ncbi:MAG: hypothetical protein LBK76_09010 [Verrucomicrobiales bacterium]|nr:hypothetical protein [Verrucomicrobiales bacterium]